MVVTRVCAIVKIGESFEAFYFRAIQLQLDAKAPVIQLIAFGKLSGCCGAGVRNQLCTTLVTGWVL